MRMSKDCSVRRRRGVKLVPPSAEEVIQRSVASGPPRGSNVKSKYDTARTPCFFTAREGVKAWVTRLELASRGRVHVRPPSNDAASTIWLRKGGALVTVNRTSDHARYSVREPGRGSAATAGRPSRTGCPSVRSTTPPWGVRSLGVQASTTMGVDGVRLLWVERWLL